MSLRKSSRSRNGSKSDVLPNPNARRRCTPAPSRVGLDLMSRLTGRRDMLGSSTEVYRVEHGAANGSARLLLRVDGLVDSLDEHVRGPTSQRGAPSGIVIASRP